MKPNIQSATLVPTSFTNNLSECHIAARVIFFYRGKVILRKYFPLSAFISTYTFNQHACLSSTIIYVRHMGFSEF